VHLIPLFSSGAKIHPGEYIATLSPEVQKAEQWETAAKALMPVVESGGPSMMALIGMMRAISHGKAVTTAPRKKRMRAHGRKLRQPYTPSRFMAISKIFAGSVSVAPTSLILRASISDAV
jgi:hypothetical protein